MSGDPVFLDTNCLVYANDTSSPEKREKARTLIRTLISDGSGCISTQVLAEFWVTATQKLKTPLERSIAIHQITLFSSFTVQTVDHATVLEALRLQERYRLPIGIRRLSRPLPLHSAGFYIRKICRTKPFMTALPYEIHSNDPDGSPVHGASIPAPKK